MNIRMNSKPSRLTYRSHEMPALLGVGRQTYYSWLDQESPQHDPTFPKPIQLGGLGARAKGHLASEIEEWLASRPRAFLLADDDEPATVQRGVR